MVEREALVAAVDVGSSKVAVAVAEAAPGGPLALRGLGTAPSRGVEKGVAIDAEALTRSLAGALREAEIASGCEIRSAWLAVGGAQSRSFDTHGVLDVSGGRISDRDVARVAAMARRIELPPEWALLHADLHRVLLDGQPLEGNFVGMAGSRLEAFGHVVTVPTSSTVTALRACQQVGLHVVGVAYSPHASGVAVLDPEAEADGVVIDLGAGTTGFAVFARGRLRMAGAVPVGGNHVSGDVAAGLGIAFREAERLKRCVAHAVPAEVPEDDYIDVPTTEDDEGEDSVRIQRRQLAEVVQLRVEEIFELVRKRLDRFGVLDLAKQAVWLVGGGADLHGCTTVAEQVFGAVAGIGLPAGWVGLDGRSAGRPADAAVLGTIRLAARARDDPGAGSVRGGWSRWRRLVGNWFQARRMAHVRTRRNRGGSMVGSAGWKEARG